MARLEPLKWSSVVNGYVNNHQAGCEAAIHTMNSLFSDSDNDAVLLIDASNAFNQLNRNAALLNITRLCPSVAPAIVNTYRSPAELFVDGEVIHSSEGTVQGDPLAMCMYALAMMPLIFRLDEQALVTQVWFADDATANGKIKKIREWWNLLNDIGPGYGYYVNAQKSWLIVKDKSFTEAKEIFEGSNVQITTQGQRHLGAALGSSTFVESYVSDKVKSWVDEIIMLTEIAKSQPHAAYAALSHSLIHKWTYIARTIPDISDLFTPLEDAIRYHLLPAIMGRDAFSDSERELFSFPTRLGGLGIINLVKESNDFYLASKEITAPLSLLILQQSKQCPDTVSSQQNQIKQTLKKRKRQKQNDQADTLKEDLAPQLQRAMELNQEKGASQWLNAIPLASQGFALHKGAFRDALCFRYGWHPKHLPTHCRCGKIFSVEHAFTCSYGGYPTLRHNAIRDFTAELMQEVCHDVKIEPHLQPLSGEAFHYRSSITDENARLDIKARGFWGGSFESAFFDIRVFNPFAPSNLKTSLEATFRRHEKEKKRAYEQRVLEVEHGSFTPIVLSASGGIGKLATTTYSRLAGLLAEKRDIPYSQCMGWIRCCLSFCLLKSAIMCLRGSRGSGRTIRYSDEDVPLVTSEAKIDC